MNSLPSHATYALIGAGIHGLSTAMHLAQKLAARGTTVGPGGTRIVVLDKTGIGAGASGIACGVVRNNYYQLRCASSWRIASPFGKATPRRTATTPSLHADQPGSDARAGRLDLPSSRRRSATNRCSSRAKRRRWRT
jgi:glycine/D-amino acid oxidase-like deaminating enzyme